MRIYKPVGSKDRFVEIFQNVNKIKLNEDLGFNAMDAKTALARGFQALKNGQLSIQGGGSNNTTIQMTDDNSTVQIVGEDSNKNQYTFVFKLEFNEGDQEGVFNIQSVKIEHFTYTNANGNETLDLDESALKNFNTQYTNELFDIIEKYVDVKSSVPQQQDAEQFNEAVRIIDSIPFGKDSYDKMQTGKNYGDKKPTNDTVRVKSPELDKFVQEDVMQTGKAYADEKPTNSDVRVQSPELDKFVQEDNSKYSQEVDTQDLEPINPEDFQDEPIDNVPTVDDELPVDGEPVPELSPEKREKILTAYENIIKRSGKPDYMPTTPEVLAELDKMNDVKRPDKIRTFSKEAEPYLEENDDLINRAIIAERNLAIQQAILNVDRKLSQLGKRVDNEELTRLVKEEAIKILNERRMMVSNESVSLNEEKEKKDKEKKDKGNKDKKDSIDSYSPFKQLGTKFKPKSQSRYPKKKKKPQTSVKINESTDQDKYEDVVFLQGDDAFQPLEILDSKGADAALEYLKQWHYPGEHQGSQELGHGSGDKTYEKDGYIMSWNSRLGYIGLQYDLSKLSEEAEPNAEKGILDKPLGDNNTEQNELGDAIEPEVTPEPSTGSVEKLPQDNGMSLEPQGDEVQQLAQDKEETGEMLQGGVGDGKSPLEFDPEQILKGMEVETEHSDNPMVSIEIVLDHLTEDPEYYTEKETPEASAQAGASKDVSGGGEDNLGDKELTDMLLGYQPKNVGDEIEITDDEPEEEIPHTPETPEEPQEIGNTEEEPQKLQEGSEKFSTAEKTKLGKTTLFAYPDEQGVETREGLDSWVSKDRPNRELQFVKTKEDATNSLKTISESKESELKQRDPATWHQIQIAKKTLRMPGAMAGVMGGMSKEEAKQILTKRGIKFDEK